MRLQGKFTTPANIGLPVETYDSAAAEIMPDTLLVYSGFATATFGIYSSESSKEFLTTFACSVDLEKAKDETAYRMDETYCLMAISALANQAKQNVLQDMEILL